MFFLAFAIWVFVAVRLLIAAINLFTRQWLKEGVAMSNGKVSILIPARNEAHNLGMLLNSIMNQSYPNWEVLVYDDLSEDDTAKVVHSFRKKDIRIRLIRGKELPKGWLGKNFACHQQALQATGQYFLFLDADVMLEKNLVNDSLAHIQKHKLDLLSIFPQQIMKTWGEKVSVPVMNWVLVSLLPLILTRKSTWPAFAAANGQHMLFKGNTYRKHQFHKLFRAKAVEDIAIARYMKQKMLRIHTLLSNGQIKCRMYNSLNEALQGFSKNVLAFFGNNLPTAIIIVLVTTLGVVPIYLSLGLDIALIFLLFTLIIRIVAAYISRQNVLNILITAPVQQVVFCIMVTVAIHKRLTRKNIWKGRIINA